MGRGLVPTVRLTSELSGLENATDPAKGSPVSITERRVTVDWQSCAAAVRGWMSASCTATLVTPLYVSARGVGSEVVAELRASGGWWFGTWPVKSPQGWDIAVSKRLQDGCSGVRVEEESWRAAEEVTLALAGRAPMNSGGTVIRCGNEQLRLHGQNDSRPATRRSPFLQHEWLLAAGPSRTTI
jgi:hypothetical protein